MKFIQKLAAGTFLFIGVICLMIPAAVMLEPDRTEEDRDAAIGGSILGIPSVAIGGWLVWNLRRRHKETLQERLQSAFFSALQQGQGHITPLRLAMAANITGEEARAYLDEHAKVYHANFNVSEEGELSYYFPLNAGEIQFPPHSEAVKSIQPTTELTFDVILEAIPDYKQREVIKVVQKLTGLSWKEVKALVRNLPQPIQQRANRETAKAFRKELEAVGAQVSLVLN